MDTLILSCSTGGGHNTAGKAILEELTLRGHNAQMLDPYSLLNNKMDHHIGQSYVKLVQHAPVLFGMLYRMGNAYRKLPWSSPVYLLNSLMVPVMEKYLQEHPVDTIVMPHIFPAQILSNMKQKGITVPKTVLIATDYTCIPFTEESCCDRYIVPAADLADEFAGWGIPKEKIVPLGIPVNHRFSSERPRSERRAESCERLHLDPKKHYILLSGGSMGAGNLKKIITYLQQFLSSQQDIELIVICGSNLSLYDALENHPLPHTTVVGYTDSMPDYMNVAEFILTKPGGLSSTEAAVSSTPLLHFSPIPGCESRNICYFEQHGMNVAVRSLKKELIPAVKTLLSPQKQEEIRENQKSCINSHASEDICDLLESLVS